MPRRGRLFAAKAAAVTIFSALLGLVTVTLTYLSPCRSWAIRLALYQTPEYLGFFWGTALAFAIIG